MQITQTLLLADCALSALAFPLEDSNSLKSSRDALNLLEGRASSYAVDCKGTSDSDHKECTQNEVKSAYDSGRKKVKAEDCTVTDQNSSAKPYGASDSKVLAGLPSECKNLGIKGKLFEYRIQGSDTERVVWTCHKKDGNKAGYSDFCLVMTHRGQIENGSKPCDKA